MLDTTDYLMESLETWKSLGLSYDLVYIGYVTGLVQAEKLCRVADDGAGTWRARRGGPDFGG